MQHSLEMHLYVICVPDELKHYFKMMTPKVIFTESDLLENAKSACGVLDYKVMCMCAYYQHHIN